MAGHEHVSFYVGTGRENRPEWFDREAGLVGWSVYAPMPDDRALSVAIREAVGGEYAGEIATGTGYWEGEIERMVRVDLYLPGVTREQIEITAGRLARFTGNRAVLWVREIKPGNTGATTYRIRQGVGTRHDIAGLEGWTLYDDGTLEIVGDAFVGDGTESVTYVESAETPAAFAPRTA